MHLRYPPFEVAYGLKPKQPIDLIPLPTSVRTVNMVMHLHVIYEIYMKMYEKKSKSIMRTIKR